MASIDYGTPSYFLYIGIMVALTAFFDVLFKNRSTRVKTLVLFLLLLSAFGLHFLKLILVERYARGLPYTVTYASLENICAVSVIVFPWIFLSRHRGLRDYMVIVGTLSGLAAFLIPTEGIGRDPFSAGVLRFYYSHFVIFVVPYLMARWKLHRIDLRRIFVLPFYVYGVMALIMVNEFVLNALGLVNATFQDYLSAEFRNTAFVFGIPEILSDFKPFMYALTPKVFLTHPITGDFLHWPILWVMIPLYLYGIVLASMVCFFFEGTRSRALLKGLFIQTKEPCQSKV
ncbi:MAG: hypothetical protein K9K93_06230 [Acholeplasmataceae bacterium]|nr:hypothetical protein [Acholeplasmataceae bacterium]